MPRSAAQQQIGFSIIEAHANEYLRRFEHRQSLLPEAMRNLVLIVLGWSPGTRGAFVRESLGGHSYHDALTLIRTCGRLDC